MNLQPFARATERRMLHGAMLGALDSAFETATDDVVKPETFVSIAPVIDPAFVHKPYEEAVRWFKSKNVVDKATYEAMSARAKQRAFTIAGMARDDMLRTAHAELTRQVQEGANLADFKSFVKTRLESAGWVPANASHVETIFRTNVMNAYGAGRHAEMTQPSVLQARPYWQILGVDDSRTRDPHKAVHGFVLRAGDPMWRTVYPPFGYNCRCRIRSLSPELVAKMGLTVRVGSDVRDLPDEGFVCGTGSLLSIDPPKPSPAPALPKVPPPPPPPPPPKGKPEHDPAHWEETYAHLGDAAPQAAYGHAMKERGLDMPFAQVAQHLDKLAAYPEYEYRSSALRSLDKGNYPTMRHYLEGKAAAPHIDAAAAVAGHMQALADAGAATTKLDVVADFSRLKKVEVKGATVAARSQVTRADSFFRSAVASDRKIAKPTIAFQTNGRSDYQARPHTVSLNINRPGMVLEHELMHVLEEHNRDALVSATKFLDARTKGEALQRLDKLYPEADYTAHELATPDKFPDGYMGKRYKVGSVTYATEITSMGVQHLLEDPAVFYEKDPEYFHWVLGQLKGGM